MLKHLYVIWILFATAVASSLAGCSDELIAPGNEPGQPSAVEEGTVFVRLRINMGGSGIPGRAASDGLGTSGEYEGGPDLSDWTPGTDREKAITSMDLLVCDADSENVIDMVSLAWVQVKQILSNETIGVNIPVKENSRVHIYVLVNLPDRLRSSLVVGQPASDALYFSGGGNYWDVMNDFVPGCDGSQETLENGGTGGIPMTGQFRDDKTSSYDIVLSGDSSKDAPIELTADLSRIVAKAHVLVKSFPSDLNGIEYVYVKNPNAASDAAAGDEKVSDIQTTWLGWMRMDSVRYIPNAVNRSTYILPHPSDGRKDAPQWADLNMNLSAYLVGGTSRNLEFDAPAWARDFVYYNGISLHRENIAPDCHLAPVEKFDQTRYDCTVAGQYVAADGSKDRYTKGMYCLENYFYNPSADEIGQELVEKFDSHDEAMPIVTHLSIAAHLTPRCIVVQSNYMEHMDNFVKEYQSNAAEFYRHYGLTDKDFNDGDVERWLIIKERYNDYFTKDDYLYRGKAFRFIQLGYEADAMDILSWSLMCNSLWSGDSADFERNKYPDGTFYCYDRLKYDTNNSNLQVGGVEWNQRYLYLAAGAVAAATGENADIKTYSVPHLGGWGYYYTYLNQMPSPEYVNGAVVPYSASQVTRNTYYLVTINNFGSPGGTITRPEYIKVNTEPVGWDYTGRGDINLH